MAHLAVVPQTRPDLEALPGPQRPLGRLPSDWVVCDRTEIAGVAVDRVVVGPNGVFTVVVDPDPRPAAVTDDGLMRAGGRVTTPVKRALAAAFGLRGMLAPLLPHVFPYPLLAVNGHAGMGFVGRLRVVTAPELAEAVWSHCGRPLLRSERRAVLDVVAP